MGLQKVTGKEGWNRDAPSSAPSPDPDLRTAVKDTGLPVKAPEMPIPAHCMLTVFTVKVTVQWMALENNPSPARIRTLPPLLHPFHLAISRRFSLSPSDCRGSDRPTAPNLPRSHSRSVPDIFGGPIFSASSSSWVHEPTASIGVPTHRSRVTAVGNWHMPRTGQFQADRQHVAVVVGLDFLI